MRKTLGFGLGITTAPGTVARGAYMRNVTTMQASARAGARGGWSCFGPAPRAPTTFRPPVVPEGFPAAAMNSGLGDLGRVFCTELDTTVDALKTQLRMIIAKKGSEFALTQASVQAAMSFISRYEDSAFATPVYGNNCTSATANGNSILRSLNSITSSIFGGDSTPVPDEVRSEGGLFDALGSVKTIAIAGAVIAGVVLVAPFAFKLLALGKK